MAKKDKLELDLQSFMDKVKKMERGEKLDLSSDEDLSIGIMNLISIEEHLFFSYGRTKDKKYLDLLHKIREMRKQLLKRIIKEGIGIRAAVTISEDNYEEFEETIAFLKGLGIQKIGSDWVRNSGRAKVNSEKVIPPLYGNCAKCIYRTACVTPYGTVYPCILSRERPLGSVATSTLKDVLFSPRSRNILRDISTKLKEMDTCCESSGECSFPISRIPEGWTLCDSNKKTIFYKKSLCLNKKFFGYCFEYIKSRVLMPIKYRACSVRSKIFVGKNAKKANSCRRYDIFSYRNIIFRTYGTIFYIIFIATNITSQTGLFAL